MKTLKHVLIGILIAVVALVLLVFSGFYALIWIAEAPFAENYKPTNLHEIYMKAEKVAVTCKSLEIEDVKCDADPVCGVMELDSWRLKRFARYDTYREETAITVHYSSCDYIVIYENDTARVYWVETPKWYSLPKGTYQKVFEQVKNVEELP